MAKIHRQPPSPAPHHPPHAESPPAAVKPEQVSPARDGFLLRSTLRQVYESTPFVMLCTKPDLRSLASKLPVVKEVAEAVCPAVTAIGVAIKE